MNRVAGYGSTDFTTEFLKKCHRRESGDIVTRMFRTDIEPEKI
jgi:hypothetical protein